MKTKRTLIQTEKTLVISLFMLLFSFNLTGQFPKPTTFKYSLKYISLDECDFCGSMPDYICGPKYCSTFKWNAPDFTQTSATFEYYKIYENGYMLAITEELSETFEYALMGSAWVTAVYSNPEGESEPSNIERNEDLPIGIELNDVEDDANVLYNPEIETISVIGVEKVLRINIYNNQGCLVKTENGNRTHFSISELNSGLYIVELLISENKNVIRKIFK